MSRVNEQVERLIARSLDGALTPDEELVLNREMIRDPEARRLRDEYRAVDEEIVVALRGLPSRPADLEAVFASGPIRVKRSWSVHRGWLMVPGAIAAALLAMVIPKGGVSPEATIAPPRNGAAMPFVQTPDSWSSPGNGLMRSVGSVPRVRSDTGREIIGVVGEDGNLYWIEVERTRTIRIPPSPGGSRSPFDSM